MTLTPPYALHRTDDDEFLGLIVQDVTGWQAQTIFGYTIERTETREQAETVLQKQGVSFLSGVWQYFDSAERDWFPCVIKEATPLRVIIIRTNERGIQDPETYKHVILNKPSENVLIKSH